MITSKRLASFLLAASILLSRGRADADVRSAPFIIEQLPAFALGAVLVPILGNTLEIANGEGSPLVWTIPGIVLGLAAGIVGAYYVGNTPEGEGDEWPWSLAPIDLLAGSISIAVAVWGMTSYERQVPEPQRL